MQKSYQAGAHLEGVGKGEGQPQQQQQQQKHHPAAPASAAEAAEAAAIYSQDFLGLLGDPWVHVWANLDCF